MAGENAPMPFIHVSKSLESKIGHGFKTLYSSPHPGGILALSEGILIRTDGS